MTKVEKLEFLLKEDPIKNKEKIKELLAEVNNKKNTLSEELRGLIGSNLSKIFKEDSTQNETSMKISGCCGDEPIEIIKKNSEIF